MKNKVRKADEQIKEEAKEVVSFLRQKGVACIDERNTMPYYWMMCKTKPEDHSAPFLLIGINKTSFGFILCFNFEVDFPKEKAVDGAAAVSFVNWKLGKSSIPISIVLSLQNGTMNLRMKSYGNFRRFDFEAFKLQFEGYSEIYEQLAPLFTALAQGKLTPSAFKLGVNAINFDKLWETPLSEKECKSAFSLINKVFVQGEYKDWLIKDNENYAIQTHCEFGGKFVLPINVAICKEKATLNVLCYMPFVFSDKKRETGTLASSVVNMYAANGFFDCCITNGRMIYRLSQSLSGEPIDGCLLEHLRDSAIQDIGIIVPILNELYLGEITPKTFCAKFEEAYLSDADDD